MNKKTIRIVGIVFFIVTGYILAIIGATFYNPWIQTYGIIILSAGISIYCVHLHLIKYHEKEGEKMLEEETPEEKKPEEEKPSEEEKKEE